MDEFDAIAYFLICAGFIAVVIFVFAGFLRYLRHKEILELAERGLVKAPQTNGNGKGSLRWGIVITALGIAISIGLYPFGFLMDPNPFPLYFGPWMVLGLIPMAFGLALILIYVVTADKDDPKEMPPGDEEE